MEKTKKEIVIIGLILLMVIALIGVSYAAFRFTGAGTKVNSITTGSITMTYEETSNTISLSGALPTTDATGKVRLTEGEYFDFTVSSQISGDVNINYEISAKDVTTSDRKIDGSNIKLYLTRLTEDGEEELMTPETYNEESTSNSFTGRPSGEMSLYTSSMNSSESNRYRLRMWVDEDYNPQGDGGNLSFSIQINVYGKDGLSMEDRMMMAYDSSNPSDFHSSEYKSKVTSIVTKGDTVIPEGVIESWDISEKQNGSVIAYVEDDGTGAGTYKVTIGAQDKIIANYDMGVYFHNFSNLLSIDLSYLDTSLTTDMSNMFQACTSLVEIDLSSLDTSKITDMGALFYRCLNLTNLNISTFNTSQVTNMSMMFMGCSSLTELDLSSFDTSNVTDMTSMFCCDLLTGLSMSLKSITFGENFNTSKVTSMSAMFLGCRNLTELDISNFDTSNVTSMATMFFNCSSLTELDLSNFDTSNVDGMSQMFQNCSSLTSLDLRSFDTSKVTDYRTMFNGMTNITEILVTRDTWTIPNSTIANSGVTDFTYV